MATQPIDPNTKTDAPDGPSSGQSEVDDTQVDGVGSMPDEDAASTDGDRDQNIGRSTNQNSGQGTGSTDTASGRGMVMPGEEAGAVSSPIEKQGAEVSAGTGGNEQAEGDPQVIEAPPSAGRQALQLVLIPALVCLAAIGAMFLLYNMMHRADTLETVLLRLRMNSGAGKTSIGIHDPRYQDRCRAAMTLAQMLPEIEDEAERARIGGQLVEILNETVAPEEKELAAYMLVAIGQLGPAGGLDVVLQRAASEHGLVRLFVARAVASWPRRDEAKSALPDMIKLVGDEEASVASEAARVVGILATKGDAAAIAALQEALSGDATGRREVGWNAAAALARLGDDQGSTVVASLLLDRAELAQLPAGTEGAMLQQKMPRSMQDRVIAATLTAALADGGRMTHPGVWAKIQELSEKDPNINIRKLAKALIARRNADEAAPKPAGDGGDSK